MQLPLITIDGPAGSGKSSTGLAVGNRLGIPYLDTGAMYRAAAWIIMTKGVNPKNTPAVIRIIDALDIHLLSTSLGTRVFIDGLEATQRLRLPEVTKMVGPVCEISEVRRKLVELQREWARRGFGIVEGRDIGTVVFPEARLKIYMTARPEIKAERRARDLGIAGDEVKIAELAQQISDRDRRDSERENSPLTQSPDMILIDNSNMSFREQVDTVISFASERFDLRVFKVAGKIK